MDVLRTFYEAINHYAKKGYKMNDSVTEEKQRERKKVVGGLVLTLIVFAWFLYYLISNIPG